MSSNDDLSPAERLSERKFEMFLKKHGAQWGELTIDQCLEQAVQLEQTAKDVGPFDLAFSHFISQQHQFTTLAEMLEKRKTYAHKLPNETTT